MGASPQPPINSILVYYNKNKRMESLKTLFILSPKSRTGKVETSHILLCISVMGIICKSIYQIWVFLCTASTRINHVD